MVLGWKSLHCTTVVVASTNSHRIIIVLGSGQRDKGRKFTFQTFGWWCDTGLQFLRDGFFHWRCIVYRSARRFGKFPRSNSEKIIKTGKLLGKKWITSWKYWGQAKHPRFCVRRRNFIISGENFLRRAILITNRWIHSITSLFLADNDEISSPASKFHHCASINEVGQTAAINIGIFEFYRHCKNDNS